MWPLYRFDPRLLAEGKVPLQLDSKQTKDVAEFMATETRFKIVERADMERYPRLVKMAHDQIQNRLNLYAHLAKADS